MILILALKQFAGLVRWVESRRGRNSAFEPRESTRQVEGLSPALHFGDAAQFESLLSEGFGGNK